MKVNSIPKWQVLLRKELDARDKYLGLNHQAWREATSKRRVTSDNYDTVLSIDWPHYCAGATEGCGGRKGWCYTFHGQMAAPAHSTHAGFVDALASQEPEIFAERVAVEVAVAVRRGALPYPNIRYSGSGEVERHHLPALRAIVKRGIHLWGFSRRIEIAEELRDLGASVIVSCDATSGTDFIQSARMCGFQLGYTSAGVNDSPPEGTLVTFPVHRGRHVAEVVSAPSLCPKVVEQFLKGKRRSAMCETRCKRCHLIQERTN
jgi:hypothetical protein